MKWFGEPWPSADLRAPVCEDDADRVEFFHTTSCADCPRPILPGVDRGVIVPSYDVVDGALQLGESYFHLQCFLAEVLGERAAIEMTKGWA